MDRPPWLEKHPQNLIYKYAFESQGCLGQVWYRPTGAGFEIDYIEIPTTYRGQGLGFLLLKAFINFCKNQKINKGFEIWLEVSETNTSALQLYLKMGFKKNGVRAKYYPDGSDAFLMSLLII